MDVSVERLRDDIESTAEFGAIDVETGRGRSVFTGSEADERTRNYLVSRLDEAGLTTSVDAVGNIVGRWTPESADPAAPPVAAGSHLDSVPEGGIFDGPLGVYAGLEAVRAMQECDLRPNRPIDVVCFTEEEGTRFDTPLLGSKVASGTLPVDEALDLTDDRGERLADALSGIGYHGEDRLAAEEWDAWLELHIEQGTRLEDRDVPVGVVTSITGITHCRVEISGEANHAGTTPMGGRRDALLGAAEFALDVEDAATELVETASDTAVATVGRTDVSPNGTNVVPGHVELGLDIRDVDASSMAYLVRRARESLARIERERGVETSLDRYVDIQPVAMSDRCRDAIHAAGEHTDVGTVDLHSGAGHDTMEVARVTDAGLLFAPSRDGISHNPREWTEWADCARATRVLAAGLARLATS
ncbi:M20 family metallo-hydrolase [Haloplanus halophilus]|uniref:M20 family metallo-hydrolase n=1 Tax=Haloplanus halophilus TaxID=2949993 RepID=UPI00203ECCB9|nr:M20 family metallo-hydrolase [Haloplanus sp. GDY1]